MQEASLQTRIDPAMRTFFGNTERRLSEKVGSLATTIESQQANLDALVQQVSLLVSSNVSTQNQLRVITEENRKLHQIVQQLSGKGGASAVLPSARQHKTISPEKSPEFDDPVTCWVGRKSSGGHEDTGGSDNDGVIMVSVGPSTSTGSVVSSLSTPSDHAKMHTFFQSRAKKGRNKCHGTDDNRTMPPPPSRKAPSNTHQSTPRVQQQTMNRYASPGDNIKPVVCECVILTDSHLSGLLECAYQRHLFEKLFPFPCIICNNDFTPDDFPFRGEQRKYQQSLHIAFILLEPIHRRRLCLPEPNTIWDDESRKETFQQVNTKWRILFAYLNKKSRIGKSESKWKGVANEAYHTKHKKEEGGHVVDKFNIFCGLDCASARERHHNGTYPFHAVSPVADIHTALSEYVSSNKMTVPNLKRKVLDKSEVGTAPPSSKRRK